MSLSNGTIFLDEVDQIPYNMQPKLLRVLQEQEVIPIGGKKIPINVRIIASTNKDLKAMIADQQFREDLYYRLNVVNIKIPPLREHKEDIPVLVKSRIAYLNQILNRSIKGITDETLELLYQYDWPGNVREFFNTIERSINLCNGDLLTADYFVDILLDIHKEQLRGSYSERLEGGLASILDYAEKSSIEQALKLSRKNKTKAAKLLGISRTSLHNKIKKHGIDL